MVRRGRAIPQIPHPALISPLAMRQQHIPRSSRRRSPEPPGSTRYTPQRDGLRALLLSEIPAYPRSAPQAP